ncbi:MULTISPECIES: DLW-39 family protein [unclassified Rothia (in: high G+C Gram-positive bacteria)]|nr:MULTISPECIES: DLW-39 family protein [unclassified Rothia (in: high G+C Gram-positive bacteria)]
MKKLIVIAMAGAVSFIAARKVKENQEAKATWNESTDSLN